MKSKYKKRTRFEGSYWLAFLSVKAYASNLNCFSNLYIKISLIVNEIIDLLIEAKNQMENKFHNCSLYAKIEFNYE